jgi:hypothetical protein
MDDSKYIQTQIKNNQKLKGMISADNPNFCFAKKNKSNQKRQLQCHGSPNTGYPPPPST